MATREKEPRPGAWTHRLHANAKFQLRKPPVWPRFSNSRLPLYTVAGGSQYCSHLRPTPEGSVRCYAQRASSICMCMSPQARWKMVHRSYLYMLSVSVIQAGVTCTSIFNYTAWKWQPEKKNHDLAPELAAYILTRSFSYASLVVSSILDLGMESNACEKSINVATHWHSFLTVHSAIILLRARICWVVDLPTRKPFWLGRRRRFIMWLDAFEQFSIVQLGGEWRECNAPVVSTH